MEKILLSFVVLLLVTVSANAQAVNPARQYEQSRDTQSPADGVWHVYDRYGNLLREEHYKSYRLDGVVTTFFPTGTARAITLYVDGRRQGLEKTYYPSGALMFENIYVDNDLNGESREFYETGELKTISSYRDGKLDGITKIYYKNGDLKQQWTYHHGIIHGTQITYGDDGQIKSEDDYQNGILVAHKDFTDIAAYSSTDSPDAASAPNGNAAAPPVTGNAPTKITQ